MMKGTYWLTLLQYVGGWGMAAAGVLEVLEVFATTKGGKEERKMEGEEEERGGCACYPFSV